MKTKRNLRLVPHSLTVLLLLLLFSSSFLCKVVNGEEQQQQQQQEQQAVHEEQRVCSEDDQTCHVKEMNEPIRFVDDDDSFHEEEDVAPFDDDDFSEDEDGEDRDDDYDDDYDDDEYYGVNEEDFDDCKDNHPKCLEWATIGECKANPGYMLNECKYSCSVCDNEQGAKYGKRQNIRSGDKDYAELVKVLEKMDKYMEEQIIGDPKLSYLAPRCKNRHEDCAFWSLKGECDANPAYMLTKCAPVCNTCHQLDFSVRCPKKPDAYDVWEAGDLNKMFERIVDGEDSDVYNTSVISRPSYPPGTDEENADFKIGPWVITVDDFLTDEECDTLIKLGADEGYKRSEDVGKLLYDGSYDSVQSSSRTSYNAWCSNACYDDPTAKDVMAKIEKITGIPEPNSENLQLLRYNEGEFYKTHHDYIDNQENFPAGPRLITAFLYLNDVEEGGGTNFPRLNITVNPKRGRLLIWPSVLDSDPTKKDGRTMHQALPVEKGVKYGANGWLHLRDFKEPNGRNCT